MTITMTIIITNDNLMMVTMRHINNSDAKTNCR